MMCDNNLWKNMIYPPVKNAKRKEIYKVQFLKYGCALDSHLSSEGFSAICHFKLILHRNSNICFNHSLFNIVFSGILVIMTFQTSLSWMIPVLPVFGYILVHDIEKSFIHRMLPHRISLLCL